MSGRSKIIVNGPGQNELINLPAIGVICFTYFVTSPGSDSVDYTDYGLLAAKAVGSGECERAILVCGTGLGMSLIANKVKGVRATVCHDLFTVEMSRRHNDANVLCLGADVVNHDLLEQKIKLFVETKFEGGRHARRVGKIMDAESS